MKNSFMLGWYSISLVALCSCGGSSNDTTPTPATELTISGSPATDGIFDPAPMSDTSGNLWMSYSTVNYSASAAASGAALTEVRTRIASSPDGGSTWTDAGIDPNNNSAPDLQVPNPWTSIGLVWADWHYEVSSLLYDPYDADPAKRWKMLWNRVLFVSNGSDSILSKDSNWIGLSTASTPNGTWSAERKLFAGLLYNTADNVFIGAPEIQLNTLNTSLNGCGIFTEPSMLAKSDGIYISLACMGTTSKIVGVKCDRTFTTCSYLGDFLQGSEAAKFSQSGQTLDGFSASELVSVDSNDYLIVTPTESDIYRGCLAFRISNLANATLDRSGGVPVLVKRISGTSGSFNGACSYDPRATGSGIIYSEATTSAPQYHLFASHITLP
jgi:hypothetical protein